MVTSARTIRQYCSVCKATLDMSVVDTVQDHEVTWLKCPRCNGILPHMIAGEEEEPSAATTTATPPAEPTPGEFSETERSAAQDYDSAGIFEVGQVVYHRSINKFARVVEKTVLAGQRAAIRVRFEDGEEMTLREHV
jgi:Zn-finger nucleic acid-binding protein